MAGNVTAEVAVNTGKRKKTYRETAYGLFSKAIREDMCKKFGGLQAFNEHITKNYYEEGDDQLKVSTIKTAVVSKMWSDAPSAVKSFFERAAERKNAWEKEQAALDAISEPKSIITSVAAEAKMLSDEDDDPNGRTRPAGGGKARRIGMAATSNPTGPVGRDAGNPVAENTADFKAQEKVSGKQQGRQTARKSAPVDREGNSRRKGSGARNEAKGVKPTPVAEGTTCETEKASVSKSSEAVVTPGGKLRKPIDEEGGKSNNDNDTVAKQKGSKGTPKITLPAEISAKELKVQGKGKEADEGEGVDKAKGAARAQSVGVGISGERGERKRIDGASEINKDRRVANGKNNGTGKTSGQGTSKDVDGARSREGRVGKAAEKVLRDERKAKSTGKEISGSDKSKDVSRTGSKVDMPTTPGSEDTNLRKESDSNTPRAKGKSTGVKGEEAPSENEVSTSKVKGKAKEKAIVAEKRKLKDGESVKGDSTGAALSPKSQVEPREGRKDSRRTATPKTIKSPNREKVATGSKKDSSQRANLGSPVTPRGRRANTVVSKKSDDSPGGGVRASIFGLEAGDKVPIEVEWPVEVQKSRKKTEERLEWFTATVDLLKQVRTDEEGRPKWVIFYARHGSLPASKSKVTFLTEDTLMDDFEDEPLRWRKKGSNVKSPAESDFSPRRPGSTTGSVASSCDQEAEWDDVFGSKSRRRS